MASKSKKRQSQAVDESDDGFIDDSDDHSRPKKARTEVKPSSTNCSDNKTLRTLSGGAGKIDSNGDVYWEISRLRRVTVSSFKGRTMVNIREYYEKDGNELPGKKVRLVYLTFMNLPYVGKLILTIVFSFRESPCQ
mgnify:CR=1 FL=1